ncbi:pentatricopeptide repeat-containing protein At1g66345, mitochondrial [Aristolochia californica]|uniref:pentatricopeptide repeat-containing protein At1g66345, mitochondrial n=1 Tax=Aristolochia californica TaxID=171875 RepID=UPI0035E38A6F
MLVSLSSGRRVLSAVSHFGAHSLLLELTRHTSRTLLVRSHVVEPGKFIHTGGKGLNFVDTVCDSVRKSGNWDQWSGDLHTVELNGDVVEKILLKFKDPADARRALSFFHWAARCKNVLHGVQSYCIMVQILVRARLLIDAQVLLESVIKKNDRGGSSNFEIIELLLRSYANTDSNPFLFDFLIQTYASLRMAEAAFEACLYLEEHGFPFSLTSFNKLVHVAQKAGQDELVWKVYEHMIVKRTFPNDITIRIMINAMCKEGILQKVVNTLDRIHGKRCTPIIIVNTCLVLKILEDKRIDEGILLLKRMLQRNMVIDDIAYTLTIYAHCKVGNLDSVCESYEDVTKRGYHMNSFLYTLFIGAYCKKGKVGEASHLMQEMKLEGLKPYEDTYNFLVEGCSRVGRLEASLLWFDEMLGRSLLPSSVACNEMIRKLCEVGDVKKANDILTLLLDRGFMPTEETYFYLLDGYGKDGSYQEVLKLYHEMEYAGPPPGLMVYTSLIGTLCQCGKLCVADKYLTLMEKRSVTPTLSIYNMLIVEHFKEGNEEKVLCLYNEMIQRGLKPASWGLEFLVEKIHHSKMKKKG